MTTTRTTARFAGFLYLLLFTAPIGLVYVPGKLIVPGDAEATANNLRASGWLLRVGIASELFHQTVGIFLALVLYRLFETGNRTRAVQMVVLSLISVPIVFVNVLNEVAALVLVSGAGVLSVFDPRQLDAMAFLFLRVHGQGIAVAQIFWGLWLFPFGVLVMRSGFIPRLPGVFLIVAGVANLVDACTLLFLPPSAHILSHVATVLEAGELPIVVWLVIWGARADTSRPRAVVQATAA